MMLGLIRRMMYTPFEALFNALIFPWKLFFWKKDTTSFEQILLQYWYSGKIISRLMKLKQWQLMKYLMNDCHSTNSLQMPKTIVWPVNSALNETRLKLIYKDFWLKNTLKWRKSTNCCSNIEKIVAFAYVQTYNLWMVVFSSLWL